MRNDFINSLKDDLCKARKRKQRIRTIFLKLRKLKNYEGLSDLILLNSIVLGLVELGEPFSRNEIYSAFRMVLKDDFEIKDKSMLLKNLMEKAEGKSVF